MKKKIIFFSLLTLILLGCKSEKKTPEITHQNDNNLSGKLDEYFQTLKSLEKFNGVVLIEKEGKQILFKEYNMSGNPSSSLHIKFATAALAINFEME